MSETRVGGSEPIEADEYPFDKRVSGGRDPTLDGLRAIAVVAVVLGHAINFRWGDEPVTPILQRVAGSSAVTGVQIFFLISGYVITRLLIKEERRLGRINITGFYVRRIFRIFPALAAYIFTLLFLDYANYVQIHNNEFFAASAFLCNFGIFKCQWFVGHTWSLAVEEQFYILWPIIFLAIPSASRSTASGCLAAILIVVSYYIGQGFDNNGTSFALISIGCLVASSREAQNSINNFMGDRNWIIACCLFAIFTLFCPDIIILAIKPIFLVLLVFGAGNVKFITSILRGKLFQVIGTCSYSIYLWQEIFLARPASYNGSPPNLAFLPLMVAASWWLIEQPGIRIGRSISNRLLRGKWHPLKAA